MHKMAVPLRDRTDIATMTSVSQSQGVYPDANQFSAADHTR